MRHHIGSSYQYWKPITCSAADGKRK